ncbi:NUDIX hydrolase [Megalodesulfovibrio paquesii]
MVRAPVSGMHSPSLRPLRQSGKLPVELVEAVDSRNRPLAVMPLQVVHAQQLFHRSVRIMVYNPAGKLYLQKRSRNKSVYPGRWEISASGHAQAGESQEDAARREVAEELGIHVERLSLRLEIPATPLTAFEFITVFSAGLVHAVPRPNPEELDGGMFVDADEMDYLAREYLDVLTPGLVHLYEHKLLFPNTSDGLAKAATVP